MVPKGGIFVTHFVISSLKAFSKLLPALSISDKDPLICQGFTPKDLRSVVGKVGVNWRSAGIGVRPNEPLEGSKLYSETRRLYLETQSSETQVVSEYDSVAFESLSQNLHGLVWPITWPFLATKCSSTWIHPVEKDSKNCCRNSHLFRQALIWNLVHNVKDLWVSTNLRSNLEKRAGRKINFWR